MSPPCHHGPLPVTLPLALNAAPLLELLDALASLTAAPVVVGDGAIDDAEGLAGRPHPSVPATELNRHSARRPAPLPHQEQPLKHCLTGPADVSPDRGKLPVSRLGEPVHVAVEDRPQSLVLLVRPCAAVHDSPATSPVSASARSIGIPCDTNFWNDAARPARSKA